MNKLLLSGAVAGVIFAGLARAAVDVAPLRLEENRTVTLKKTDMMEMPGSLRVTLELSGPEAASAARFGKLHFDEAVDDQGTKLIPDKNPMMPATAGDKFTEFTNQYARTFEAQQKQKVEAPEVALTLALPKRSAAKIARLRGSFELTDSGTIKTVETTGMNAPGTKTLDIPADAGITIKTTVTAGSNSIDLDYTGDDDAVDSVEVLDSTGKVVSGGVSSWNAGGGPLHRSLMVMQPLDASMKLVVKLAVNRKVTKVAFDLKDVTLP